MDQTTWNAYHIMSNRVRAVCYQLRNVQFRAKTEIVVNRLVHTAEEQIGAMKQLEESQNILKESTSETLDVVNSGYLKLQDQQKELSSANINIQNYVTSNLRELSKEKKLIAAGQKEIALITLAIKKKIEEAQKQLRLQEDGQRSVHQKILLDLSQIQESANKVWIQLDKSTQKILETHEVTVAHYGKLMTDLEKMNYTVQHLTNVLFTMRQKVEEKFFWISSLLGDTDATVQKIYFFVLHLCYCLLGMIAASFLQVPYATRIALIVLVPFNVFLELKNEAGFPLSILSIALVVCLFVNLSSIGIINIYQRQKNTSNRVLDSNILNIHQTTKNLTASLTPNKAFLTSSTPAKLTLSNKKSYMNNCSSALLDEEFSSEDEEFFSSKSIKNEFNKEKSFLNPCSPLPKISEEEALHPEKKYSFIDKDRSSPRNIVSSVRKQLLNRRQEDDDKHLFYSPNNSHLNSSLRSNGRRSRSSTPLYEPRNNRSSTPKSLCSAICKNGFLCKNFASSESSMCFRHANDAAESTLPLQ